MDTSFTELPSKINIDPHKYYKTMRDVCYWSYEKDCNDEMITNFINKTKEYNLTEDQALAILMFNNFDFIKAEYDLKIYRPIKGLNNMEVKQLVKIISGGILKTVKSRQHRDFDDVTLKFPGYTVGDVLGAYSKHRFLVKKETFKVKRSLKKAVLKPYLTNGGLKEIETISWNDFCLDTKFQLIYEKHYGFIQDNCNFQSFISQDTSNCKHYNGISSCLYDAHNDTDVILSLLKKMNRKKCKQGSMFEKIQLSNLLSSVALERRSRSANTTPIKYEKNKLLKSLSDVSTRFGCNYLKSDLIARDEISEVSIEDQLYDYIKSDNSFLEINEYENSDDQKILKTLTVLFEKHETALSSFKDFLPAPNIFQQLCHSWSNMDFAILLLGLSEFGKNFVKISDSIFTKSEDMVASFYINHSTELNLDEIVMQSLHSTKLEYVTHDNDCKKDILLENIKVEETEGVIDVGCNSVPNTSTKHTCKSSNSKRSITSKKIKLPEVCCSIKNEPDLSSSVVMNLRSRAGSKNIMKELIDQEIKSKNMKYNSKKNLKRKVNNKDDNKIYKSKRSSTDENLS